MGRARLLDTCLGALETEDGSGLVVRTRAAPVRRGGPSVHGWTACRPAARPWSIQVRRRRTGRVARHPGLCHSPEVARRTRQGNLRLPVEAMAARAAWLVGELSPHEG